MNLDQFINDFLNIEEPKRETFVERATRFIRRDEAKRIKDEIDHDNVNAIQAGKDAQEFLDSKYYKRIVEPWIKGTIKGGLQKIIKDGDSMTEAQIKVELAGIKKVLGLLGAVKIRLAVASKIKAEINEV